MGSLRWVKLVFLTVTVGAMPACSTFSANNGSEPYHEAAFDDRNRPPKSIDPQVEYNHDRLDPLYMRTQADYYYSLGEAYSFEGDSAKAIESFREVLVYDHDSPTVRTRLGTELLRIGNITESIEQLELALKSSPNNAETHLILGGVLTTLKMYDKAIIHYQAVLNLDRNNIDARLYLGAVYAEQKKYDLAHQQFEFLLKETEFTQDHLVYYYQAKICLDQKSEKKQKQAVELLQKAIATKSDFFEGVNLLASIYKEQKQNEKAIRIYKSFQKENGSHSKVAEILSSYYLDQNNYDLAYEQLEILEAHPDYSINAKLKMALILIQKHDYHLAVRKLNEILTEVPDSEKVHFYLAAVYEELKENDLAVRHYKLVPPSSSMYGESVVHTAFILNRSNKVSEAISLLESALNAVPDQFNIYAMYASILDEKADYKKALDVLEKGLEKFPENAQMRFYYGTIQDRLGKKDKVLEEMRKVVQLDPKHIQGLNYLAFTLAENNSDLEEAEQFARRAFTLDPKDGYIMDTLGWVLFKRSQFSEAARYLEGALKLQPNVSVIAEHLGDAYAKLAKVDKAMRMYHRAVELESDLKKLETIRSKISSIENQTLTGSQRKPAAINPEK